ncbi:mitochondrial carrier [Lasallia pustulata]|uniref:Mitochondrial carrier n=1 Tax=Lasallia pustulata TaxID=136370 RepID=A0A1W5DAE3_9LECA|nr:mitochondrial carrier [Lasallia pustulata]
MSNLVPDRLKADEGKVATARHGESINLLGQKHDRLENRDEAATSAMGSNASDAESEVEISAGQKMLSAVSGSLLTSLLVTPLDVVRVRLQSQPASSFRPATIPSANPTAFSNLPPNLGVTACCREVFWVNNNARFCIANPNLSAISAAAPSSTASLAADCAVEETNRKTFTSTLDGLRKIARNEGPRSLWRGLSPTLVMAIPANVIYFTGYDALRSNKSSPINAYISDTYAPLLAGSVARVAAASVISPIEMFRTRMQATSAPPNSTNVFRSTLLGLQEMVHAQGYSSLWRGLTLTMWRDVPFSGIYWWGYEALRNGLSDARDRRGGRVPDPNRSPTRLRSRSRARQNHSVTFVDSFLAGALSGAVAALVTTPFDVGKTRQQVLKPAGDEAAAAAGKKSPRPEERSMPRFLYHIFREEGLAGLFRGWAARCLKVAPACAIMISSYEVGKKMARNVNERREGRREA